MNTIERIRKIGTLPVRVVADPVEVFYGLCRYCEEMHGGLTAGQEAGIAVDAVKYADGGNYIAFALDGLAAASLITARVTDRNAWQGGSGVFLDYVWIAPEHRGIRQGCSLIAAVFQWAEDIGAQEVFASPEQGETSLLESASTRKHVIYEIKTNGQK